MSRSRLKTSENFKEELPFSGDQIPVPMFTDSGLWVHLNIRLGKGHKIILSVPEATINAFPEYFEEEEFKTNEK